MVVTGRVVLTLLKFESFWDHLQSTNPIYEWTWSQSQYYLTRVCFDERAADQCSQSSRVRGTCDWEWKPSWLAFTYTYTTIIQHASKSEHRFGSICQYILPGLVRRVQVMRGWSRRWWSHVLMARVINRLLHKKGNKRLTMKFVPKQQKIS